MAPFKTRAELERELREQLAEVQRERKALRKAAYDLAHTLEDEPRHGEVPFPLSIVNNLIGAGLSLLERAVRWLVRAILH